MASRRAFILGISSAVVTVAALTYFTSPRRSGSDTAPTVAEEVPLTALPRAGQPPASPPPPTVLARSVTSSATAATTSNAWEVLPEANAPSPRYHQSMVWTGKEVIIWGGTDYWNFRQDGARFDPVAKIWTPLSIVHAPSPRSLHAAVWTGTDMVVWGGTHGRPRSAFVDDGGIYNPVTNVWTPLPDLPLFPRIGMGMVWTGADLIIWGGLAGTDSATIYQGDGIRYNPLTKAWAFLPVVGAPKGRWQHSMIWTGHEVIVWGGQGGTDSGRPLDDGARYDPSTNTWSPLPRANSPDPRSSHCAVWTGKEMIVWGGQGDDVMYRNGARFDPAANVWTELPLAGAPRARESAAAFWSGSEMIVWGGNNVQGQPAWDGARYDPSANTWSPLPPAPLVPRTEETAVLAGHDLIVWGGTEDDESGILPKVTPHNDGILLRLG